MRLKSNTFLLFLRVLVDSLKEIKKKNLMIWQLMD